MKKSVKKVKKVLDEVENTELWSAIERLEKDNRENISNISETRNMLLNKVDQLWGAVQNLVKRVDEVALAPTRAAWKEVAQPGDRFCVIGDKAYYHHPISRVWKNTPEEAVRHAESLIRNSDRPQTLFIVKVVCAVGARRPDLEVIPASQAVKLL